MSKDISLAVAAAKGAGVSLPMGSTVQNLYLEAGKSKKGKDFSVVYEHLKEQNKK